MARTVAAAVTVLSLLCAGCGFVKSVDPKACGPVKPTKVTVPGLTGHIAAIGHEGGSITCQFVYVMNADGSGAHAVTQPNVAWFSAELSPDSQKVAFLGYCYPGGHLSLCTINVDGSDLREVATGNLGAMEWSPDGARLAFSRTDESARTTDIYTIAADGSDEQRVTDDHAHSQQPTWSPDGQSIAYVSSLGGGEQIYRITIGETTPVVVTGGGSLNQGPAWSHDGTRIAFYSNRDGKPESAYQDSSRQKPGNGAVPNKGGSDVYVVDLASGNVARLTSDPSSNRAPSWSPDDAHLVFYSDRDNNDEAYVMTADGADQQRVSSLRGFTVFATWSV